MSSVSFQDFVDGSDLPLQEKLLERAKRTGKTATKLIILQHLMRVGFRPGPGMEVLPNTLWKNSFQVKKVSGQDKRDSNRQ